MPVLTVIAVPNGSGKSTLTSRLDFAGRENLLDPDAIARRLSPSDPRYAAIASGREVVRRIQNYLDTPERSVLRVKERVLQGGHDVSDQDVRRRYMRSLANLPEAVRISDRAVLYDNSGDEYRRMSEVRQGVVVWIAAKSAPWVTALRNTLAPRSL